MSMFNLNVNYFTDKPTWEEIVGAVARGWCDEYNSQKTMDSVLAFSISKEIYKLIHGKEYHE